MRDTQAAYARARRIYSKQAPVYSEPGYQAALEASAGRSIMAGEKLQNLYLLLQQEIPKVGGDAVVECGSYKGGSALFMAHILKGIAPAVRVFACDTFNGMPAVGSGDLHRTGDFADADLAGLYRARDAAGLDNLEIVPGLIQDTLPKLSASIALLHIDVDIYSACKSAIDLCWPRIVSGGYIIFDDADYWTCLGATQAAEELIMNRRLHTEQVDPHWVFRKP